MNESLKVQPHHLERAAYLYIRQSSMRQVLENIESTKRQYALRGRATALGWREDQIIVIDNDQGESGASAAWREGFQRLVSEVGLGRAGIVMGLEVSRLARNNADWHRLLEICALTDTLILDEDGVYDPSSFNDRLLLGLKGTMSEAELHVLQARLRGGVQGRAVCGRCGRHLRARYADRRGRLDTWYVCDRAYGNDGAPSCQTIAGAPVDAAVGALIAEKMTPAAVELAIEIRREIEARHEEADRLRSRAVERAQIEADLAQRRFMMVDPSNRLVADNLEGEWNEKLRALAKAHEEREHGRQQDKMVLDETIKKRLVAMTTDFKTLWSDTRTPNRERKRLLAHVIEDATLIKHPEAGTTTIHVRFKGGNTETLTVQNPKSSAQQVKTPPQVIERVDRLLDDYTYPEIAERLNAQGFRPGGMVRLGRADPRYTALRVAYVAKAYGLRSRFDRLRDRGLLTRHEAVARLKISADTLVRWATHGIINRYPYDAHAFLYEVPSSKPPLKHSSRWDRLVDRAAARKKARRA